MTPPLHALFQRRIDGDDALLRLARLRFEQFGLAAEVYAGSAEELEHTLGFVPADARPPMVHLSRGTNLLRDADRNWVAELIRRFGDRVSGFVVHDRPDMPTRLEEFRAAAADISHSLVDSGAARLFVEYAAGCRLDEFVAMGRALDGLDRVGLCIDTGHVGIRAARREFARNCPEAAVDLARLRATDPRLPDLADAVEAAVAAGLPAVLELTGDLARLGVPTHYHLHDGHPLVPGLSDHFGFQSRLPIPFVHRGLRSLPPLYGVSGLAAIVAAAQAFAPDRISLTLEIHQVEARLPLTDGAELFGHWRDRTNAERMNAWLAVLTEHAALIAGLPR